jgi:nicotinamidase-related amidase
MSPADTGLLVIDLQRGFLAAQPEASPIIFQATRLLEAARLLGIRIAATEQAPEKLGATVEPIAQLLPAAPHAKQVFSAAACPDLWAEWEAAEIHRVLLCGIETHICIQQTALDLLAAGYGVAVAVDAVGSRFKRDYQVALERLEASGAVLTTTEAALFEWCESAARPEFRELSQLAKRVAPQGA